MDDATSGGVVEESVFVVDDETAVEETIITNQSVCRPKFRCVSINDKQVILSILFFQGLLSDLMILQMLHSAVRLCFRTSSRALELASASLDSLMYPRSTERGGKTLILCQIGQSVVVELHWFTGEPATKLVDALLHPSNESSC